MRLSVLLTIPIFMSCAGTGPCTDAVDDVKTTFQTGGPWRPTVDNRADAVMVYGVGGNPEKGTSFEQRIASWRDHGYKVHFMSGIAWGGYKDYFTGKWDGKTHLDEGQVRESGDTIWHGVMNPYIVPSMNYLKYYKEKIIKPVIDAGIDHIFMEEPEFWADGGYSEAFKREWQDYYGTPWRPQHESPASTYLSSKLKYHLYYRALNEVFTYAKEYGREKGLDVKCYVPTHSLINYSMWTIVSPEASLASLPCVDGYIAQVWTGTSRVRNYYDGICRERVFETAFLEYGSMKSMTAPTGRKMFFLTDPIEDAVRDWDDYKRNYEATFTAQLLYPDIASYEVMPWPDRIYDGKYRQHPQDTVLQPIPRHFSTQMQVMINALNTMPLSEEPLSGPGGISVLMANSMMFQRFPIHEGYEDPQFSDFFGLALPLLKRGVPVQTAHIENLEYPETLSDTRILLMTYSNMKPLSPLSHEYLAKWVKGGGTLVYCGSDNDPFQNVPEWWNSGENSFPAPSCHLFSLLGVPSSEGDYACGNGSVHILRTDPKEFAMHGDGDLPLIALLQRLYPAVTGKELTFSNSLTLRRGIYDLAAVMDEGISSEPYTEEGLFIDLYDPELPVTTRKQVAPGEQSLMVNLGRIPNPQKPQVLASGCRIYEETCSGKSYSFIGKGPLNTTCAMRLLLPCQPSSVMVDGMESGEWDPLSHTCLLKFENNPDGVTIKIKL